MKAIYINREDEKIFAYFFVIKEGEEYKFSVIYGTGCLIGSDGYMNPMEKRVDITEEYSKWRSPEDLKQWSDEITK